MPMCLHYRALAPAVPSETDPSTSLHLTPPFNLGLSAAASGSHLASQSGALLCWVGLSGVYLGNGLGGAWVAIALTLPSSVHDAEF